MENIKNAVAGSFEIIHANVYNPSGLSLFKRDKREPARSFEIHCSNKNACEAFKNGTCVLLTTRITGEYCPYGRAVRETGYTARSKNYYSWIRDKEEKYKDVPRLSAPKSERIMEIGDYFYLPYAHLDRLAEPHKEKFKLTMTSFSFVLKTNLTIELMAAVLDLHPQAMFGGTILNYQQKIVPAFVSDLRLFQRPLFDALVLVRPGLIQYDEKKSYKGRKALLSSIKAGTTIVVNKGKWTWDGEFLTRIDSSSPIGLIGIEIEETTYKVKPKANAVIEISDDEQFDENTVFV